MTLCYISTRHLIISLSDMTAVDISRSIRDISRSIRDISRSIRFHFCPNPKLPSAKSILIFNFLILEEKENYYFCLGFHFFGFILV